MMWSIGNHPVKHSKLVGFALVEVMLAVAILSVGIIAVYQPMLASLSAFDYADDRMEINYLLSKKIWELENEVKLKDYRGVNVTETLVGREKPYTCTSSSFTLTGDHQLLQVRLKINWVRDGRTKSFMREMYLTAPLKA